MNAPLQVASNSRTGKVVISLAISAFITCAVVVSPAVAWHEYRQRRICEAKLLKAESAPTVMDADWYARGFRIVDERQVKFESVNGWKPVGAIFGRGRVIVMQMNSEVLQTTDTLSFDTGTLHVVAGLPGQSSSAGNGGNGGDLRLPAGRLLVNDVLVSSGAGGVEDDGKRAPAGDLIFRLGDGTEFIRFSPGGVVRVRGHVVANNDAAIYRHFKEWLRRAKITHGDAGPEMQQLRNNRSGGYIWLNSNSRFSPEHE